MNIITIFNLDQLNLIFDDVLCLSGEQSEEIYHNMWCISLKNDLVESIVLSQLEHFVDKLILHKEQQLNNINFHKNVVFYMWFDQQALQLRFNIITGDTKSLPFKCKLCLHSEAKYILNNFVTTVKNIAQHGDQVTFFDEKDWKNENKNEKEFVLDVFIKILKYKKINTNKKREKLS